MSVCSNPNSKLDSIGTYLTGIHWLANILFASSRHTKKVFIVNDQFFLHLVCSLPLIYLRENARNCTHSSWPMWQPDWSQSMCHSSICVDLLMLNVFSFYNSFGKSSPTNMESTQPDLITATVHCNLKGLMFTTMRHQVNSL